MELVEEIRRLASDCLTGKSQFVVDVVISSRRGPGKVLVLIDGDQSVTIDDCAEVSRHVSKKLDEAGWLDSPYLLEVSTPGVDQPLRMIRQYRKHIGRNLKITHNSTTVEGSLQEVTESSIVLKETSKKNKKEETQPVEIPFAEIEKAFVLVSFK